MGSAMKYKWIKFKSSSKQHFCTDEGNTYCKMENGSSKKATISDIPHPIKDICGICKHLSKDGNRIENLESPRKPKRQQSKRPYRDTFINTWEWKQVRYMALCKNDGKCECCGRGKLDGAVLNVDHIKPRRKHPELALTLHNLQVLCSWCNQGKNSWDDTDWRGEKLPDGAVDHMASITNIKHVINK